MLTINQTILDSIERLPQQIAARLRHLLHVRRTYLHVDQTDPELTIEIFHLTTDGLPLQPITDADRAWIKKFRKEIVGGYELLNQTDEIWCAVANGTTDKHQTKILTQILPNNLVSHIAADSRASKPTPQAIWTSYQGQDFPLWRVIPLIFYYLVKRFGVQIDVRNWLAGRDIMFSDTEGRLAIQPEHLKTLDAIGRFLVASYPTDCLVNDWKQLEKDHGARNAEAWKIHLPRPNQAPININSAVRSDADILDIYKSHIERVRGIAKSVTGLEIKPKPDPKETIANWNAGLVCPVDGGETTEKVAEAAKAVKAAKGKKKATGSAVGVGKEPKTSSWNRRNGGRRRNKLNEMVEPLFEDAGGSAEKPEEM